ncbi:hypothetical protein CMI48_02580 [Candidatus Pacearchaeota archaeon]|jgi:hypothetical protein|nr:hypothetical protein [Candidatus Pacearchaeota archaeon]
MASQKTNYQITEQPLFVGFSFLPQSFQEELQAFIVRNAVLPNNPGKEHCCDHCVKAHALKTAHNLELDDDTLDVLTSSLEGNPGHDGYYLDQGRLVKLP